MKAERNYGLAMLALVMRVYGHKQQGDQLMRCSADPLFKDLSLGADQVSRLISGCGLHCMGICVTPGDVMRALQDFANDRHVVLVGMQPSEIMPYKHWSVLEASWEGGAQLCIFGDSDEAIHSNKPMAEVTTGEYVVVTEQVENFDINNLRAAMGG